MKSDPVFGNHQPIHLENVSSKDILDASCLNLYSCVILPVNGPFP